MDFDEFDKLPQADKDVSLEKLISSFKQSQTEPTAVPQDNGEVTPPANPEPPIIDKTPAQPEVNEPPANQTPSGDKVIEPPATPNAGDDTNPPAGQTPNTDGTDPQKKVQTPEDNAKFAEMRRQQQIEQRVQEELAKRLQEAPEVKLAKQLSETYGQPVETILAQVKEAALQREAAAKQVPVELLRQQQLERERITAEQATQQAQLQDLQFQLWQNRVNGEKVQILNEYKGVLSDADVDQAVEHMLVTMQNPNLPLDQVVLALHGKKIVENLREQAKAEALAEASGRSKNPVAPVGGGKTANTPAYTEDELYVAKKMGIPIEEYLKWK